MHNNIIFESEKWSYCDKRNSQYLLIWPDIPNWMIVDEDLFRLLNKFDGHKTINEICKEISKENNENISTIKKEVADIVQILIDSQVIYEKENKKTFEEHQEKIDDITINITMKCNLNCKMCFNRFHKVQKINELSVDEIKEFLDQIKEHTGDKTMVSLSGGECLLEPEKTIEVAQHAKNLDFYGLSVVTNGTLITEEFAKKAKEIELKVMVSLDGCSSKEHDFLRGKGAFDKTIKGIKILKKHGVFVATNYMIHKDNVDRLPEYFELANELGVSKARYISFKKMGSGKENTCLEVVPFDELIEIVYDFYINNPKYKELLGIGLLGAFATQCRLKIKRGWCGTGRNSILLDSDGSIYPCSGHTFPEFKAGNIRKKSFIDIWFNSPILKKIRCAYDVDNIEKCSRCVVKNWCLSCKSETYQNTNKLNSPDIQCEERRRAIIEMFWKISKHPNLGRGRVDLAH